MAIQFGVGTLLISATSNSVAVGKLQNVSLNISYDMVSLRGNAEKFASDMQPSDATMEGSFEFADIQLSQIGRILFGSGSFAGAGGSGTITVTGQAKPQAFQIVFSGVTNGITGTWKLQKVFVPSLSLDFSRTEYTLPSMNFVCADTGGAMMTWQQ